MITSDNRKHDDTPKQILIGNRGQKGRMSSQP